MHTYNNTETLFKIWNPHLIQLSYENSDNHTWAYYMSNKYYAYINQHSNIYLKFKTLTSFSFPIKIVIIILLAIKVLYVNDINVCYCLFYS